MHLAKGRAAPGRYPRLLLLLTLAGFLTMHVLGIVVTHSGVPEADVGSLHLAHDAHMGPQGPHEESPHAHGLLLGCAVALVGIAGLLLRQRRDAPVAPPKARDRRFVRHPRVTSVWHPLALLTSPGVLRI